MTDSDQYGDAIGQLRTMADLLLTISIGVIVGAVFAMHVFGVSQLSPSNPITLVPPAVGSTLAVAIEWVIKRD